MTIVYRIQPVGLGIVGHYSETSGGEEDCGCHVFLSLEDVRQAIRGWVNDDSVLPELLTVRCTDEDLEDNEDYEGMTLVDSVGKIIKRQPFADWDTLRIWFDNNTPTPR